VIGSGTILDTGRFRMLLAEHYGVDPRSVHAHMAGEHGDTEVPVWSSANIAGMPLRDFGVTTGIGNDADALEKIYTDTRDAAYQIIERKGATFYAVAAGLVRIVEAIPRSSAGTGSSGSCRWGCPPRRRPAFAGPRSCCARPSATSGSTSLPDAIAGRNRRSCPRMGS
jgi:L-lactate dehydrogenase